jgi:hypothetical protein
MEAILAEYGHSIYDEPTLDFATRSEIFGVSSINISAGEARPGSYSNAGWMTPRAWDGLVRRILHAIMTEDKFVFAMGGHSAAAGHGNHFQQSYSVQVQKVLEPVFARLGVLMEGRNFGMGGLGTIQNALGGGYVYGNDLDILLWDSGMTEKGPQDLDMFMRQAMLAGRKVPVIWSNIGIEVWDAYADADVGDVGINRNWRALSGVTTTNDPVQVDSLPWAMQYLSCSNEMGNQCRQQAYRGVCWIERDDVTTPPNQSPEPGGRASWHPGDRSHQFAGRGLAFAVLRALDKALNLWSAADNYRLDDSAWHVDGYYANIKTKIVNMPPELGACYTSTTWSAAFCKYPMQARTEFTPRNNPFETSIRSIVKDGVESMHYGPNYYDPPDVYNPNLVVPDGVFEVSTITPAI